MAFACFDHNHIQTIDKLQAQNELLARSSYKNIEQRIMPSSEIDNDLCTWFLIDLETSLESSCVKRLGFHKSGQLKSDFFFGFSRINLEVRSITILKLDRLLRKQSSMYVCYWNWHPMQVLELWLAWKHEKHKVLYFWTGVTVEFHFHEGWLVDVEGRSGHVLWLWPVPVWWQTPHLLLFVCLLYCSKFESRRFFLFKAPRGLPRVLIGAGSMTVGDGVSSILARLSSTCRCW